MKKYIYFIILLFIIFYIYCYYIFDDNFVIQQVNIDDFNFNLLYNKQPLVIEDKIVDISKILSSWFKQNIIKYNNIIFDKWNINNNKYLFIYAEQDSFILIDKPNIKTTIPDNNNKIVSIKLYENQCIILPFKCKYYIEKNNNIKIIGIHDYITYFLEILFFL